MTEDGDCIAPGQLMGLAPLARMAFAGADLTPVKADLLNRLQRNDDDANALMDLSTVCQLMGLRSLGLSMQAFALRLRQVYRISNSGVSAGLRLLGILAPGDLAQNNALEFLVEGSDIRLDLLYVEPTLPFPATLPEHDLAMVAVCETDRNRPLLRHLAKLLQSWPRPVICPPDRIARLSRDGASRLLQSLPGAVMPLTVRVSRPMFEGAACSEQAAALAPGIGFPLVVRPVDSQKGCGLERLDGPEAIYGYLAARPENEFYVSRYIDYSRRDGQFRKYRIVLIDGKPYACHMAISERWIVHYMNAGMRESAVKRAEEARFFADFEEDFARRHRDALLSVARRLELEYVGIDCGETPDGELLIFEVDSGMTVHAMDSSDIFPYKQPQMAKVFRAFRQMLRDATIRQGVPLRPG